MKSTSDVVVVGGGAAGLFAAGRAAEQGLSVKLLEKNDKVGRKLGITGKGRCNLTNRTSAEKVIENIPTNGRFLYSAVNSFTPEDTVSFFEGLGVPLKTERGDRVFPVSDRAADIVNALRSYIARTGVKRVTDEARALILEEGKTLGVLGAGGEYRAESVILATGGMSYPATGSTGDGYRLAAQAGHTLVQPKPSLVPLEEDGDWCRRMQGFSLKNVAIRVEDEKGKKVFDDFGEMLFTHFGVSGPVILSASAHMRDFDRHRYTLYIDLKPALDEKKLDTRILRDFEKYANRTFQNALGDLAGRSMIPVLVERSGIPPETRVHEITKAQRADLVRLMKRFAVSIRGPRPIEEAIITSGGVSVKEVDPRTMASKKAEGLYFAGEILDVDAYTGGFNLQIAWATANAAAQAVIHRKGYLT